MNRVVFATVAMAALAGASVLGVFEVRQAREFRRLLAVGDAALARDQTSAAVEAYSGAIALRQDSMLGWLKRGDTYRRRRDYGPALRDLEAAANRDPAAPRPIELLGDVYAGSGDQARAVEFYTRYLGLDDRAPRVLYKLGLAHYRLDHRGQALEAARRALALDRQLPEAYYLLGLCERDARRPRPAAAAFAQAVALDGTFAAAREELAALELAAGRHREAMAQLDALAALDPHRAARLVAVARTYARSGRFEAAVVALDRALEHFPDAAEVHLALARLWLDAAEDRLRPAALMHAREALQGVATRDPGTPEFLLLRGRLQLLAGDAASAERSLQSATATLPVEASAFRYLATAAERVGHAEAAHRARAQYAALVP